MGLNTREVESPREIMSSDSQQYRNGETDSPIKTTYITSSPCPTLPTSSSTPSPSKATRTRFRRLNDRPRCPECGIHEAGEGAWARMGFVRVIGVAPLSCAYYSFFPFVTRYCVIEGWFLGKQWCRRHHLVHDHERLDRVSLSHPGHGL